jgi:hypothetical protein
MQLVPLTVVPHQHVLPAVTVEIEHREIEPESGRRTDRASLEAITEVLVPSISSGGNPSRPGQHLDPAETRRRERFQRIEFEVPHRDQIEITISVEITQSHRGRPPGVVVQPPDGRGIGETPVALVQPESVHAEGSDQYVVPTIVVHIADRDPETPGVMVFKTASLGRILECKSPGLH